MRYFKKVLSLSRDGTHRTLLSVCIGRPAMRLNDVSLLNFDIFEGHGGQRWWLPQPGGSSL